MVSRQCSVYLVDNASVKKDSTEEIVVSIMREINKDLNGKAEKAKSKNYPYKQQKMKIEENEIGLNVKLYYRFHKYIPEWRGFISQITEPDSTINDAQNKMSSFICFFYNSEYIFVVCAGYGSFQFKNMSIKFLVLKYLPN